MVMKKLLCFYKSSLVNRTTHILFLLPLPTCYIICLGKAVGTLSSERMFPEKSNVFDMLMIGDTLIVPRYEDKLILYYKAICLDTHIMSSW